MSWPHHVYFKTYLFFGLSHSSEGQSAYLDYLSQVACLFICLSVCSHIPSAWCCPTVLPTELRMIVFILCLDQKFSFNLNFIYLLLCLHMTCKEKQKKNFWQDFLGLSFKGVYFFEHSCYSHGFCTFAVVPHYFYY